jgi:hypothetical protein
LIFNRSHPHIEGVNAVRTNQTIRKLGAAVAVAAAVAVLAVPAGASGKAKALTGTFGVAAGAESGTTVTGSYFRMVQPGGTNTAGPFVPNADSTATDKSYSLLTPGTDGGLITGKYQPDPSPAFDPTGNGLASAIVVPVKFFGVGFAVSTNKTDPQTSTATKLPKVTVKGSKLSGDLDAVSVAYGGQNFNQGAPKPGGERPTGTSGPKGTYDAKTGKYTLDWTSPIVGGSFDGFTGVWHLEGTFKAKK